MGAFGDATRLGRQLSDAILPRRAAFSCSISDLARSHPVAETRVRQRSAFCYTDVAASDRLSGTSAVASRSACNRISGRPGMPRKTNYDFERREREKHKAAEAAKKAQAKADKKASERIFSDFNPTPGV